VNQGEFNSIVNLTDVGGNNVGNPLVLYSAGHDYSALMDGGVCNAVDSHQVQLEGSVNGATADYAGGGMINGAMITQTWMSGGAGVLAGASGLMTAGLENTCETITWTLMSSDPLLAIVDPTCASGSFVACVDSAGIDVPTRATWLPIGDIDGNYSSLPSGPVMGGAGSVVGFTWIVNTGVNGVGAYAAQSQYDEMFIDDSMAFSPPDTMSIGGSTQASLGGPFAVNTMNPGVTRWNDVDAFATHSGIFDISTQTFSNTGAGSSQIRYINEELADGSACNIWVTNPCMPFNSFVCPMPPPAGGYQTIAGTATITTP
jgi:hypothetical protein